VFKDQAQFESQFSEKEVNSYKNPIINSLEREFSSGSLAGRDLVTVIERAKHYLCSISGRNSLSESLVSTSRDCILLEYQVVLQQLQRERRKIFWIQRSVSH